MSRGESPGAYCFAQALCRVFDGDVFINRWQHLFLIWHFTSGSQSHTGEKAGEQEWSICYFQSHCFKRQSRRCLSREDFLPSWLDLEAEDIFSWLCIIILKCFPRIFSGKHVHIVLCQLGKLLENKEHFSEEKKKKENRSFITALKGCLINICSYF